MVDGTFKVISLQPFERATRNQPIAMQAQVFIYNFDIPQKLVERLYGIHKIHSNYGRVFSEWSAIEKEMADGLQTAGHYMDV